jgi:leucyl aminopeptidase (aminopeptidase T)
MKQQIEVIAKPFNLKEVQTKNGKWLYSFSIQIAKEDLAEWLQVAILQEDRRETLSKAKEVHFTGELTIKPAYKEHPQGLSVFGFFIEGVFGKVWRVQQ